MLLFILSSNSIPKMIGRFQYISCYSLSKMAAGLIIPELCFNTSHVTLYPEVSDGNTKQSVFQYISCYSLSGHNEESDLWRNVSIHLMLLFIGEETERLVCKETFQYISCYSLSNCTDLTQPFQNGFNTSHVTLYQHLDIAKASAKERFNTSHVTLYHLPDSRNIRKWTFQYISCYSLSERRWRKKNEIHVSIHLMLLFIESRMANCTSRRSFNTSHVTLYQITA